MNRLLAAAALVSLSGLACEANNQTHTTSHQPYQGAEGIPLSCLPNLDGVIDSAELAPTLDEPASFIVSPPLPAGAEQGFFVNTAGAVNQAGRLIWDWSVDDPSHLLAQLRATPLGEQWFANLFPGGQFALAPDLEGQLQAVYSHDETALRLHGVASTDENPPEGKTLMIYEQPIDFFRFPLTLGKSWSQTGVVESGTLLGLEPWSQHDTYEVTVDAAGELRLPDFTFKQVLRVTTKVTLTPLTSGESSSQRQVSFVFECFGEVARASSMVFSDPADDPGSSFTFARETRKLGWF